jgi:chemotaxis response regulator CheB
MPRMDGLTFLKKVMQYQPMPVIVISWWGLHRAKPQFRLSKPAQSMFWRNRAAHNQSENCGLAWLPKSAPPKSPA